MEPTREHRVLQTHTRMCETCLDLTDQADATIHLNSTLQLCNVSFRGALGLHLVLCRVEVLGPPALPCGYHAGTFTTFWRPPSVGQVQWCQ